MSKVLLIEDDPVDVRWVRRALAGSTSGPKLGGEFEVVLASDLEEGLRLLAEREFGLILLDLGLPDSDGEEALTRTRSAAMGVPIVVLTGRDEDAMVAMALRAGAHDYIVKGTTEPAALRRAVHYAIERQRLQASYQDLYDNAPDMFCSIDAEEWRVIECNRTLEETLGYSRNEILGRPIADLCYPPSREIAEAAFESLGRAGRISNAEIQLMRSNGAPIDVSLSVSAVRDGSGRILHSRCVWRDISDLKSLQEELMQSQKMEATGRLAGGVAHDFNNLMTVILGYSESIRSQIPAQDAIHAEIEEIREAAMRASSLTQQLLAFSRKQVLHPVVLDMNGVVKRIGKLVDRLIGEDVEIVSSLDSDLHPVRFDPNQLEQIVLNLAVNARDAMPQGGRLTIRTANVNLTEQHAREHTDARPGPHVMLSLEDTGCGMDGETLARIFEPFFTTKGRGEGTGLGLSTVYGIMKQSGGSITVESSPGRGTTFRAYLPRAEATTPASDADATDSPRDPGGCTILVVEADACSRKLLCRVLREGGYEVLSTRGIEEAIDACTSRETAIHLLVTDVLPSLGAGSELVRRHPGMKILHMSDYTDHALDPHEGPYPDTAVIQKPIAAATLLQRVRDVMHDGMAPVPA